MGNGNYYSTAVSGSIFKIENNTLYRYASNTEFVENRYTYYVSAVRGNKSIQWLRSILYSTSEEANNLFEREINNIANEIEQNGYIKPKIGETRLGQYSGTIEELKYLALKISATTTTLEELEERPIVIEQKDKTDET